MRLKTIYASPLEKQLYIQSQILNRGINVTLNTDSTPTEDSITFDGSVASLLVEANPNRKVLIITNSTANPVFYSTSETALTLGIAIPANTTIALSPAPTSALYIYSDNAGEVTYLEY